MSSDVSSHRTKNQYNLTDRVAVVTGSDSGIGQGIALLLAQSGCHVTVCYHKDEKGALETAQKIHDFGRKSLIIQVDISDEEQVKELIEKTLKNFDNHIDIFINNAGISGDFNNVIDKEFRDWEEVFRVNIHGTYLCSKLIAKQYLKQNLEKIN
ncbi:unnamed protein product [Adineta ricciae]|uniref:Uncharacterized protein n=1 Tax=Adineta ricciae TaxID=249248 RepID=A0A816HC94_ADIRI|nr:unnamed protein product [Adineta ricciae]